MSKYFFKVNIFSSRRFFEVQCRTIFGTKRNITNFLIDSLRSCLELVLEIENTSWKVLAYGIYARVVDVSEIERVSAANE